MSMLPNGFGHKESPHSPIQCTNVVRLLLGLASMRVALCVLFAEALTEMRHPGTGVCLQREWETRAVATLDYDTRTPSTR